MIDFPYRVIFGPGEIVTYDPPRPTVEQIYRGKGPRMAARYRWPWTSSVDAVAMDWPRWGRRILVSMNREARIQRSPELSGLRNIVDATKPLVYVPSADAVLHEPFPGAEHIEIGWAEPGKLYPMPETHERRFFKRLRRAFRYG